MTIHDIKLDIQVLIRETAELTTAEGRETLKAKKLMSHLLDAYEDATMLGAYIDARAARADRA